MSKAYVCAVRLLARREHGAQELSEKLAQKGHEPDEITKIIAECQRLGLQSDSRFAESLCRRRIQQGYGSHRIRQELKEKHIEEYLIAKALEPYQDSWIEYAQEVWGKKFKHLEDNSFESQQKQKKFLQYRGFSHDIIAAVIDN